MDILVKTVYYHRCFTLICIKLTEAVDLSDIFHFISMKSHFLKQTLGKREET